MQFEAFKEVYQDDIVLQSRDIMMVMAYTNDYTVGTVCQLINEQYAKLHGYAFHADVKSPEEMNVLITPKLHFTWYKIYILLKLMNDEKNKHIKYFFWIDGDALILHMEKTLQDFIINGNQKELIIAEDMHTCCLINAGVFFLKNSDWSLGLLEEIWQSDKYNEVYYYEQSALIKSLKQRRERLNYLRPFHSFVPKGPVGVKFFPHVAVYPHRMFSSNIAVTKRDLKDYAYLFSSSMTEESCTLKACVTHPVVVSGGRDVDDDNDHIGNNDQEEQPVSTTTVKDLLVFHAAGLKHKLDYLRIVLQKYQLVQYLSDEEYQRIQSLSFRLQRNKLGHYQSEVPYTTPEE